MNFNFEKNTQKALNGKITVSDDKSTFKFIAQFAICFGINLHKNLKLAL